MKMRGLRHTHTHTHTEESSLDMRDGFHVAPETERTPSLMNGFALWISLHERHGNVGMSHKTVARCLSRFGDAP